MLFPPISPSISSSSWAQSSDTDAYNIRALYQSPDGNIFRCVLAEDADISQYDVCSYATDYGSSTDGAAGEVTAGATSAIDGTLDTINIIAGIAAGDITDNNLGFLCVSGLHRVNTTGDATDTIAAGDNLVARGGNDPDGTAVAASAQEEHAVWGLAVEAESGEQVLAVIRRCL